MIANVMTGLRILVSAVLLFCPVFSPVFYALFLIAGLSDMADDCVFVAVCMIKILPVMDIPICSVATFAAIQEGHFIRTGKVPKQKNPPAESGR